MKKVTPKKKLGQHFLQDETIAVKIIGSLSDSSSNSLLEVGPGMGMLSKHLFSSYDRFWAFDIDNDSIDYLKNKYSGFSEKIVNADFLAIDLRDYGDSISIIGNFPYNISSQILFKIYDNRHHVEEVVCMIQKEVANRIVAQPGNKTIGILSILLQAFYHIELLFEVSPNSFYPPPKVNSAVIRMTRNDVKYLDCDENQFKIIVKNGFGKRRKTLRNALKNLILPASILEDKLLDLRAEQLNVSDFITLTNKLTRAWKQ